MSDDPAETVVKPPGAAPISKLPLVMREAAKAGEVVASAISAKAVVMGRMVMEQSFKGRVSARWTSLLGSLQFADAT
jgi:hypothetical protein